MIEQDFKAARSNDGDLNDVLLMLLLASSESERSISSNEEDVITTLVNLRGEQRVTQYDALTHGKLTCTAERSPCMTHGRGRMTDA